MSDRAYRILAINPGSTSTKLALFDGMQEVFRENLEHPSRELHAFASLAAQKPYRMEKILQVLAAHGVPEESIGVFVGRGGIHEAMTGGTYRINRLLYEHACRNWREEHPSNLGPQLAHDLASRHGRPAFIVNPPCVDEFTEEAHVCGLRGVWRTSCLHALNQKEAGIRYAKRQGLRYEDMNLIIAHIGGGLSIAAHRHGRMVDSNDALRGTGAFAPTRSGALPALDLIEMCFCGSYSRQDMKDMVTKKGGLVSHLGTSDVRKARAMAAAGDEYAALVLRAMTYQIEKEIGAMAAVLKGRVDAILLTGRVSFDRALVEDISRDMAYLAPVAAMPGEFELEALAHGALRVLTGEEQAKEYTGVPPHGLARFDAWAKRAE